MRARDAGDALGGGGGTQEEIFGRQGCEAPDRWLTHRVPRSPAPAWSSSSPNALYWGTSRPLSPHRMADGASPFLGRRDFVYPSSARGKDQNLLFFSSRRLPPIVQHTLVPRGGGVGGGQSQSPLLTLALSWGRGSRSPSQHHSPRHGLPKLR